MKTLFLPLLLILLSSSSSVLLAHAVSPAGTIERTIKQQILASLPPEHAGTTPTAAATPPGSSQLFLISPSGKYTAFFLRRPTMLGAGGFGNEFCYIQVQEAGQSVWESDCAPVSSENTCSLVFDDSGLEVFDGSNSMWNTDANADNFLETLELVDSGDMRLRDKDGNLAWRASDNPQANQNCGSMGSPGLAPETPPFAKPIQNNAPFGQPAPVQQPQLPAVPVALGPAGSVDLSAGGVGAPLVQPPQGQLGDQELPQPGVGGVGAPVVQPPQGQLGDQELPQPGVGGVGAPLVQPPQGQLGDQELPQPGVGGVGAPQGQVADQELPQTPVGYNQPPISGSFNQPFSSVNKPQPFGGSSSYQQQPLVDNNPFDSGSTRNLPFKLGAALVSITTLTVYYVFLL